MSKKLAFWTSQPSTVGEVNVYDLIVGIHVLISVLVLVFSSLFNAHYIKKRHHLLIMAEEPTSAPKNMISLKSLMLALFFTVPTIAVTLIYQKSSEMEFPLGLFLSALTLTVANMYLARKPEFRRYFIRRLRQLEQQLPACPVVRRPRFIISRVNPTQDIEMS